jgi:hypothetical protein
LGRRGEGGEGGFTCIQKECLQSFIVYPCDGGDEDYDSKLKKSKREKGISIERDETRWN